MAQYSVNSMSAVFSVIQVYFAVFSSMPMGRTAFSVCMVIRRTLFDHNLWVLFKVQQEHTPLKFLGQSNESIKGTGRMEFWRHSRLLQTPGLQKELKLQISLVRKMYIVCELM